jgi:hypothetical protein
LIICFIGVNMGVIQILWTPALPFIDNPCVLAV